MVLIKKFTNEEGHKPQLFVGACHRAVPPFHSLPYFVENVKTDRHILLITVMGPGGADSKVMAEVDSHIHSGGRECPSEPAGEVAEPSTPIYRNAHGLKDEPTGTCCWLVCGFMWPLRQNHTPGGLANRS